jgi:bifunctional N-acetylglucosamine-1-phosphate-uridyltransferase/glucosamine-1-phosphate-acetyltransferase GlmU-like protein
MLSNESFFDLTDYPHPQLITREAYVWEGLNNLKEYMGDYPFLPLFTGIFKNTSPLDRTLILHNGDIIDGEDATLVWGNTSAGELKVILNDELLAGASVLMAGSCFLGEKIEIGKGVLIETGAMIKSPAIIGDCNEVRQGAYLRGHIISGRGCVLGHTTEIKHAIFLNDAKAGHFNYIGDSILGNNTNLGAGTKFANLRFLEGNIFVEIEEKQIDTGRRKFGAILGDNSQSGCNSVTNPGTILGKDSLIMPNATVRAGYHSPGSVIRK